MCSIMISKSCFVDARITSIERNINGGLNCFHNTKLKHRVLLFSVF